MATLSLLIFFSLILSTTANIHKSSLLTSNLLFHQQQEKQTHNLSSPTEFFQVTKPIKKPNSKPCSTLLILSHNFSYTYTKPPVLSHYAPPTTCPSQEFSKIVLKWTATCQGRQFDRIFGVWLSGVEILRSCTAEPRVNGIIWTVEKDITKYQSLLRNNQTLAVYLGNVVDDTYTGVYHVNLTIDFYGDEKNEFLGDLDGGSAYGYDSRADLILPISRNLPLNDGLWFEIQNSDERVLKSFEIPQNAYRAVLEVYVSFHENDEFWYSNLPNEYIAVNNLTGTPGNGPFREVVVSLDGTVVGVVWPFTVIYTGGVNPLLWRPITGIGSFDLPSYDIEITPFLGTLLDGKVHEFGFGVTNALNVWYIDANLHVWLDKKSSNTAGRLSNSYNLPPVVILESNFTGLNGTFLTSAKRSISSSGWVKSSHGKILTKFTQSLDYNNYMTMGKDGELQIVDQIIDFNDSVYTNSPPPSSYSVKSFKSFPLYMYSDTVDQGNGTYSLVSNVTLGFNEKKVKPSRSGSWVSSLNNLQNGEGVMIVKGNLVQSGVAGTQQVYQYEDKDFCYFRNVSSFNYTIIYDDVGSICRPTLAFELARRFPSGKAFV